MGWTPPGGIALGASLIVTMGSAVGETPVVEIDRVAQWYGLTPTEARLAVWLAGGKSLQDYAALRAVSLNAHLPQDRRDQPGATRRDARAAANAPERRELSFCN